MTSVGRRRVWSLVGGWLAVSCLLPRAELVDDDGSGGRSATGGSAGSAVNCLEANLDRCEPKSCDAVCVEDDGDYCRKSCRAVLDCVRKNPSCMTAADPMCGLRTVGRENVCTLQWEMAAGKEGKPAQVAAREYIQCLCGQ